MPHPLFERHRALLERAVQAIHERSYWSAFPESASPKVYGEGAAEAGKAEFDALLNHRFPLTQPATVGDVGGERSPFGIPLGVTYPKPDMDGLLAAVGRAHDQWRKADPETWAGVCLETLVRINKASFAIANAVISLLKLVADPTSKLPEITYWLMGSMAGVGFGALMPRRPRNARGKA